MNVRAVLRMTVSATVIGLQRRHSECYDATPFFHLARDSIYAERDICYRPSICPSLYRVGQKKVIPCSVLLISQQRM